MSNYHKNCTKNDKGPPRKPDPCKITRKVISADGEERCPKQDDEYLKLLDVITSEAACSCEITARAVRSDIHANLGLTKRTSIEKCVCETTSEAAGSTHKK